MRPSARVIDPRTVLLVGLLAVTACSAFSLAWNYADRAVIARIDEWVELDSDQRTRLQGRLQPWLQTLARERFPDYADFLRAIEQRTQGGFDAADTRWAYTEARSRFEVLLADALGWLAPTLHELTPAQRDELAASMHERNEEYRSSYVTARPRERGRPIAERLIQNVERWTGPLDVHQQQLVHKGVADMPDTFVPWLEYRMRMQARLLTALREEAPPAEIERILHEWWIERDSQSPEQRSAQASFERDLVELVGELTTTFTPLQRAMLSRRLRQLADNLDTIHTNARAS